MQGIYETASHLKIGKDTLYKICEENGIKTQKRGKKRVFTPEQTVILEKAAEAFRNKKPVGLVAKEVVKEKVEEPKVYTTGFICRKFKIGRPKLKFYLQKTGCTLYRQGSAKVVSEENFKLIKSAIEADRKLYDDCKRIGYPEEIEENKEIYKEDSFLEKARSTIRDFEEKSGKSIQGKTNSPKQESFYLEDPVPENNGKRNSALICELRDENNVLTQTLFDERKILSKKQNDLEKLTREVEYLRTQYESLKKEMESTTEIMNCFRKIYNHFK